VARGLKFLLWHFAMTFATDFVVQRKTGDDAAVSMEESSGNVVADLGLRTPGWIKGVGEPFSASQITVSDTFAL
jgi:hypothetical protein